MQRFDVLIVGGGMVGLATALAIRHFTQYSVAIVDTQELTELPKEHDVRVSALNLASQQLLSKLGAWSEIENSRCQPYTHMHVWDDMGYGKLDFDVSDVNNLNQNDQLGWIVENNVIRRALWKQAELDSGISFFQQEKLTSLSQGDKEVFATFESQAPIIARLVVGADGANSWVRQQANIAMTFRDYDHHAIVATVHCEQGHQLTAWQNFLPTGPLAFLPLDSDNGKLCSIVWSAEPEKCDELMSMDAESLSKALTAATDGKLGAVTLRSDTFRFPLTMRFAQSFVENRIVLVGDAAHTIHPLAGQGVNLGFVDAASLAQILGEAKRSSSWPDESSLLSYQRWRKADAMAMISAMEGIKQAFTPQQEPLKFLRGMGMTLVNNVPLIKQHLIKQALGQKDNLPELMSS